MAQTSYSQREQALADLLAKNVQAKALLDQAKSLLDQSRIACDPTLFAGGTQLCLSEIAADATANPGDTAFADQQARATKLVAEAISRASFATAFAALRDVALSVDLSAGLTDQAKSDLKAALVNAGMISA